MTTTLAKWRRCYICSRVTDIFEGEPWTVRLSRRMVDIVLCPECDRRVEPKARKAVGEVMRRARASHG